MKGRKVQTACRSSDGLAWGGDEASGNRCFLWSGGTGCYGEGGQPSRVKSVWVSRCMIEPGILPWCSPLWGQWWCLRQTNGTIESCPLGSQSSPLIVLKSSWGAYYCSRTIAVEPLIPSVSDPQVGYLGQDPTEARGHYYSEGKTTLPASSMPLLWKLWKFTRSQS